MIGVQFTEAPDGEDGPFLLASNGEWMEAIEWIRERADEFPKLSHLVETGTTSNSMAVAIELEEIEGVQALQELARYIGGGDTEERVSIVEM